MIVAVSRVLNEDDIAAESARRMAAQVDHVIIGEGGSVDGTREAIQALVDEGLPITLQDDPTRNHEQARVMTELAHQAREMGATWVIPYDTDEVWLGRDGRVADTLANLPPEAMLAPARLINHICTSADPDEPNPFKRMGWRETQVLPLPKVACRALPDLSIHDGNHGASYDTRHVLSVTDMLEVRHFPYRSPEQFIKRIEIAWPQVRDSDKPESYAAHIRAYGQHLEEFGPEGLRRWFKNAMFFEDPENNPDLIYDPLP